MNLFELNPSTYEVEISAEVLSLKPFKKVVSKDRSIHKDTAKAELSYIWFLADVKSDYKYIADEDIRSEEIIKDLKLPDGWKPDLRIRDAIKFYRERSTSINKIIYEAAYQSATDISDYLKQTKKYLEDGTLDISKATAALKSVPIIMRDLKAAEKEILLEEKDNVGRKKGSKTFNMMEDGNY